jgi:hypothetical protein
VKWYLIAQLKDYITQVSIPQNLSLVSLMDVIELYQLELDYSNYLSRRDEATESEYY